jgi:hypothetical protein
LERRYGYVSPSWICQTVSKSQSTKVDCCFISAVVLPYATLDTLPATELQPDASVSQKVFVTVFDAPYCPNSPPVWAVPDVSCTADAE